MLKCINQASKEVIIILNPHWKNRLSELRNLDLLNRLVCPVCSQPVRIRAGKVRIWHFAHKHLQNCPLQFESPLLLQARAILYEWLLSHFSAETVSVEKIIPDLTFPRYVDCWVDQEPAPLIYWVLDTRRPPVERAQLQDAIESSHFQVNPVFTHSLLHPDHLDPRRLFLSTTERAFMVASPYDQTIRGYTVSQGKTIHYLDAENRLLLTYRNLHPIHPPQEFLGVLLKSSLVNIFPSPQNGEFVHPGEDQKLHHIQTETQILLEKRQRTIPRLLKKQTTDLGESYLPGLSSLPTVAPAASIKEHQPFERFSTCRVCGKSTSDWISFDGKTGTCLCRNCTINKKGNK
jgi:hypothetical protein